MKTLPKKHPSRLAVHFSSKKGDHETPAWLYEYCDKKYGFKADLAAASHNKLHKNYFSIERSAFDNLWPKGWSWCNPPYGRELVKWCLRAKSMAEEGRYSVMLLPARTDTRWFHNVVLPYASYVVFIGSRLTFKGNPAPAPFPSMLVIWGKREGTIKLLTLRKPDGRRSKNTQPKKNVQRTSKRTSQGHLQRTA